MTEKILGIVFVLACIGYVVWIFYGIYNRSELLSSGKILKRDKDFPSYLEKFTLRPITDADFLEAVKAAGLVDGTDAHMSGNARKVMFRSGTKRSVYYEAVLELVEQSDEKSVYQFLFLQWRERYRLPHFENEMNQILTAVERMFVGLDRNTKVHLTRQAITRTRC